MTIEIKEKGSEAFYREVVSVTTQYQRLIKKPDLKYRDLFKSYRSMGLCMAVLFGMQLWLGALDGFNALRITALTVVAVVVFVVFLYDRMMRKLVKGYIEDERPSTVIMDDGGIEINKCNAQIVRLAWDNIAFVRKFKESICFFAKDNSRIVLAVTTEYEQEIMKYFDDNGIDIIRV